MPVPESAPDHRPNEEPPIPRRRLPSHVSVRRATARDVERVAELTVRAYVGEGLLAPDDHYLDQLRDVAARMLTAEVWVADLDEQVVGAVTFCPPGSPYRELSAEGQGEFRMLAVDPASRRRGVARTLVRRCIERCRELGLTELVLCSMPTMTPAHGLYASLGFRRDESLDWDVEPGLRLVGFRAAV
jgi:ribosomal protein S18 acetylase RimI-like enzyme